MMCICLGGIDRMRVLLTTAALLAAFFTSGVEAFAFTPPKAQVSAGSKAVKVRWHHRGRHSGGRFAHWCAYNCYSVPPGTQPPLGNYRYSQYRYDEDLPLRHRWDWDASPTDNVLAQIHPYTGDPFLRLFERTY